jgi:hypothetical protein
MSGNETVEARLAAVVGGVLRQLVRDTGAAGLFLPAGASPEAVLARRWAGLALGERAVHEAPRDGLLVADPVNKSALLLEPVVRAADVLPLGDVYASQVERLAGGWSGAPETCELAERAGGIDVLDRALADWADRRVSLRLAFAGLPAGVREDVLRALERARHARRAVPVVPKLAARTAGIDLFA